jgi:hypothetical protein
MSLKRNDMKMRLKNDTEMRLTPEGGLSRCPF